MLFNSLTFLVFLAVVFLLFWAIRNWSARKNLLLVASYLFYAAWSPPYIFLLLASTTLDWWLARRLGRIESPRGRRGLLILSLISNLGLLGYFKYSEFLLVNCAAMLSLIGVSYQPPVVDIILPVGISFYTFASLSYTIDVYRRQVRADWGFRDYALFVSFFPHLVAGPIVRASKLLPQIETPRDPTAQQVGWGLVLVCIGLFGKVVMADTIFAPLVDEVYANPSRYSATDVWTAVLAFSGQIYYDFSGYSLCAIGLALCFGFAFPDNFRHPYAARGFSDFWRRWHISLSTWLRDYLYIGLGGNRHGDFRTYVNLMLTMLIGGLWHGASWMFVIWGALHGAYLALERAIAGAPSQESHRSGLRDVAFGLFTFLVVTLTWIPFRAPAMDAAAGIVSGLFRFGEASVIEPTRLIPALLAMLATGIAHFRLRDVSLEAEFAGLGRVTQIGVLAAALAGLYLCSGGEQRAFIYFQF